MSTASAHESATETETPDSFYVRVGPDHFLPTFATMSPWDAAAQHGGPPTALLAAMIEEHAGGPDRRLTRLSVDFLGPIPRGELTIAVTVLRPGRRAQLTEAVLTAGGRPTIIARAWHLAVGSGVPPVHTDEPLPTRPPESMPPPFFPGIKRWGYGEAIEWRFVRGGFDVPGPAAVWTRVRLPLVAGTELTGLERALIVADSANGISAELSFDKWMFVPPTLTVTMSRAAVGEWVLLSAGSQLEADGVGLTTGALFDDSGMLGNATQPLYVAPR